MFNTVLHALFPINNGTWTHFRNLLNQSPINDARVWGCCQVYHNTQGSIDCKLLAQRAGTFQMLKKYSISKNCIDFHPTKFGSVLPHHSTVCFHERRLLGLPAFYSWQLLSPLSRPSPHLLVSLHMCSYRKQVSYDNIWPKESIVWWLLSLISGGKLTYWPVLSHCTGKKGAGTSLQQEWIQRLSLSLYLYGLGSVGGVWLQFHLLNVVTGTVAAGSSNLILAVLWL